jgi:hypothetical protein
MNKFGRIIFISAFLILAPYISYSQFKTVSNVQNQGRENSSISFGDGSVFVPIEKYIRKGDVQSLSAWYAENLQISMVGKISNCSKNQARQILKNFFKDNPPRSFEIVYKSGSYPMQCAVGDFSGGGYDYSITIMVKTNEKGSFVEQIRINRK